MVRVPGYTTEMYCASCEVRTEFIYGRLDSRDYQKKKVVVLEVGPLSLVSTTEELLDRIVSAPVSPVGLESPEYGREDPLH
jgi:hypothetical protein